MIGDFFNILFILFGICGFAVVLILAVIGFVTGKRKKTLSLLPWGIFFLLITIFSSYLFLPDQEDHQQEKRDLTPFIQIKDDLSHDADSSSRARHLKMITSNTPDSLKEFIPSDFLKNDGHNNWYRIPLTYPYAIYSGNNLKSGVLSNEITLKHTHLGIETDSIHLKGDILAVNYDANFILLEISKGADKNDSSDVAKATGYLLYNVIRNDFTNYPSTEVLWNDTLLRTFKGKRGFRSLSTEFNTIFGYNEIK